MHALAGMALRGIEMGAQESIIRAAVAGTAAREKRSAACGVFNAACGVAWFPGGAPTEILYDRAIPMLAAFAVSAKVAAAPLFMLMRRAMRPQEWSAAHEARPDEVVAKVSKRDDVYYCYGRSRVRKRGSGSCEEDRPSGL